MCLPAPQVAELQYDLRQSKASQGTNAQSLQAEVARLTAENQQLAAQVRGLCTGHMLSV